MDDYVDAKGKRYISSKQVAKLTGYSKDYVGQLCRSGKVDARIIGRSWFVAADQKIGKCDLRAGACVDDGDVLQGDALDAGTNAHCTAGFISAPEEPSHLCRVPAPRFLLTAARTLVLATVVGFVFFGSTLSFLYGLPAQLGSSYESFSRGDAREAGRTYALIIVRVLDTATDLAGESSRVLRRVAGSAARAATAMGSAVVEDTFHVVNVTDAMTWAVESLPTHLREIGRVSIEYAARAVRGVVTFGNRTMGLMDASRRSVSSGVSALAVSVQAAGRTVASTPVGSGAASVRGAAVTVGDWFETGARLLSDAFSAGIRVVSGHFTGETKATVAGEVPSAGDVALEPDEEEVAPEPEPAPDVTETESVSPEEAAAQLSVEE